MAWRLDEAVIRGELNAFARGVVTGRIWLAGREEPLELQLKGNPWRDLAGRRLEFVNPAPRVLPIVGAIPARQHGLIGDLTASRRMKVYRWAVPGSTRNGQAWSWSNGLYFEWFNTADERMLIEAVTYRLKISPEATWEMRAVEEQRQRELNAAAREDHRARLLAAEAGMSAADYDAPRESGREDADGGWVEEPPAEAVVQKQGPTLAPQPEVTMTAEAMAQIGEALSAAAGLIQIWDTGNGRPTAQHCDDAITRLGLISRELGLVRLVAEFCRREKLAEAVWIQEVLRELRLHTVACERLLAELRKRESREN